MHARALCSLWNCNNMPDPFLAKCLTRQPNMFRPIHLSYGCAGDKCCVIGWCAISDSTDLSLCSAVCRPAGPDWYTGVRDRTIICDAAWEQRIAACDDFSTQHAVPTHTVCICPTHCRLFVLKERKGMIVYIVHLYYKWCESAHAWIT